MMVAMVVMSERLEKRPWATLEVFPPPMFAATAFVSLFPVFSAASLRERLGGRGGGGLYIVIFRSG
jgi:hypothetical protein